MSGTLFFVWHQGLLLIRNSGDPAQVRDGIWTIHAPFGSNILPNS
jgi:hypothetical protein